MLTDQDTDRKINTSHAKQALNFALTPGETFQLTALSTAPVKVIGIKTFTSVPAAIKWADKYELAGSIVFTLNAVSPGQGDNKTKAEDIVLRRNLMVDVDPKKGVDGGPATLTEQTAARKTANRIRTALRDLGCGDPMLTSTGNGYQMLYAIDLPSEYDAAVENKILIKSVLEGLAHAFDDEFAKIDTGVYDAPRTARLAGTWNRKGEDTLERPHRIAVLMKLPAERTALSKNKLGRLCKEFPAPVAKTKTRTAANNRLVVTGHAPELECINAGEPEIGVNELAKYQSWADNQLALVATAPKGIRHETLVSAASALAGRLHLHIYEREKIGEALESAIEAAGALDEAAIKTIRGQIDWGEENPLERFTVGETSGPGPDDVNESVDDPHRLARLFLSQRYTHSAGLKLRAYNGQFHSWDHAYKPIVDGELQNAVATIVKAEFDRLNLVEIKRWEAAGKTKDGKPSARPSVRKVTGPLIQNVMLALRALCAVPATTLQPAWLTDKPPFPAADVLPMRNALVHLPTYVKGESVATSLPTPLFFSPYALDFPFNAQAAKPKRWLEFLASVWPDDKQSIATLREWLGHLLTPDNKQEKICMIVGPTRSGKGTIRGVISGLLGHDNVAVATFASLGTNFGLANLVGKPTCVISDARLSAKTDSTMVLERLLSISGGDPQHVDVKYQAPVSVQLPTRFTIMSNELPRFNESSGALAGRLLILQMTNSFLGKEDRSLADALKAERPGILLWAIEGWKRLRERKEFIQPKSGEEVLEQMAEIASPVKAFVNECCEVKPDGEVCRDELYAAYRGWCTKEGRDHPGIATTFGRDLKAAFPKLGATQRRQSDGTRKRLHTGLKLLKRFPPPILNSIHGGRPSSN